MKALLAKLPFLAKLLAKKQGSAAPAAEPVVSAAKETVEAPHAESARRAVQEEQDMLKRLIVGVMLLTLMLWGGGTYYFLHSWRASHPKGHALAPHAGPTAHGDAHGEGHAKAPHEAEAAEHADDSHDIVGQTSPLPKAVRVRQDGKQEAGHDLEEPEFEVTRSLASRLTQDLVVGRKDERYITLPGIIASLEFENGYRASLAAVVVLEVDGKTAGDEVLARQTEFVGAIGSLAGERTRSSMLTFNGIADFKKSVHSELNHLLRNGRIKDVLFTDYFVK